jgi:O-methyltransferase
MKMLAEILDSCYLSLRRRLSGSQTLEQRFEWLVQYGARTCPEYRFTWPQLAWWNDGEFFDILDKFDERNGMNTHRVWTLVQLIRLTDHLDGDTAECGVFKGKSSFFLAKSNRQFSPNRLHHAFDSFEGLNDPDSLDGNHWKKGDLSCPLETVKRNLAEFGSQIVYHPDWIPNRFKDVADKTFRFVHIDVDLYQPTLDSLEFFYPRMVAGGVIVCDDYMFTTCPGATEACDSFVLDRPEKMISLACGGGFLIKGVSSRETKAPTGIIHRS